VPAYSLPAPPEVSAVQIALVLGLSLFFGLAFEEFYASELPDRPGGVRTFPLLALAGAGLYLVEPRFALAFVAGLAVLGSWIYAYVRRQIKATTVHTEGDFIVPIANVLAYVLGPIAITQPVWVPITCAVAAVMLLGARKRLHELARTVSTDEYLTAGKFLILVGIVLPLLRDQPPILNTGITPFKIWLAVVAVSSISYASYLAQRYIFPKGGTLISAVLGGLYSSTATTVVLAQRARVDGVSHDIEAGIIAATAMMYLRVLIVCSIFNTALGRTLAPWLAILCVAGLILAWIRHRLGAKPVGDPTLPTNPLQIGTAFVFAFLLVVVSLAATWVQTHLGREGVLALGAVVGFTDIDPFVLSLAQGGVANVGLVTSAMAILFATSSNNALKAIYTVLFSRRRESLVPAAALALSSVAGIVIALVFIK
jgi:uncharacterized membrane protein (DUF4010 family)